jgi:hypothetical protein
VLCIRGHNLELKRYLIGVARNLYFYWPEARLPVKSPCTALFANMARRRKFTYPVMASGFSTGYLPIYGSS